MALTVGTTQPFAPYDPKGASQSANIMSFPVVASQAIRKGDILVLASGVADPVDAAQTDGTILGVALHAKASTAGAVFSDQVLVAAAIPGALFTGHLVGGAATNYTANAAAAITASTHDSILGTDAYTGYLLIDQTDTTGGQIRMVQYDNAQLGGLTFSFGGTAIVNPRVIFCFRNSAFQPLA